MRAGVCLLLGLSVVLVVAGCGGRTTSSYRAPTTQACLVKRHLVVGGRLDFVASSSPAGAFVVHLSDKNFVTVTFGTTNADAVRLQLAYSQFAFPNVKQMLPTVLRRYNNAILLWHVNPSPQDLSAVVNCLK